VPPAAACCRKQLSETQMTRVLSKKAPTPCSACAGGCSLSHHHPLHFARRVAECFSRCSSLRAGLITVTASRIGLYPKHVPPRHPPPLQPLCCPCAGGASSAAARPTVESEISSCRCAVCQPRVCFHRSFMIAMSLFYSRALTFFVPLPLREGLFCDICLEPLGSEVSDGPEAEGSAVVELKCPHAHAFHEVIVILWWSSVPHSTLLSPTSRAISVVLCHG
jgi:hypothetical protein